MSDLLTPQPAPVDTGRDHLADAYQEALDGCVYLRAHIEEGSNGYLVADRAWDAYWAAVRHAYDLRSIIVLRDLEKTK